MARSFVFKQDLVSVRDDRMQRMATGHVNPGGFTHGSSADRVRWFSRGFCTGRVDQCDTFGSGR